MQYTNVIKGVLAICVGGAIMARPLFFTGTGVYPITELFRDIFIHYKGPLIFLATATASDMAHFSLGALIISLGFDAAKKIWWPLGVLTAVSFITTAALVIAITR